MTNRMVPRSLITTAPPELLGTGTRDGTRFLRDDGVWAAPGGAGIDRAAEGAATVPNSPRIGVVQEATGTNNSATFGAPLTPGNLVLLWATRRSGTLSQGSGPTLTSIAAVTNLADGGFFQRWGAMFYRVVESGDTGTFGFAGALSNVIVSAVELSGPRAFTSADITAWAAQDTVAASTAIACGGAVSPAVSGNAAFVFGGAAIGTQGTVPTVTPSVDYIELLDHDTGGVHPEHWSGYQTVAPASGSYVPGGTATLSQTYCGVSVLVEVEVTTVNDPAPRLVDGDDTTYRQIGGTVAAQIDLGGAYRIVRSRLLIGCQSAGAKSYGLYGATESDYGDEVLLGTYSFTSTGSYATNDVEITFNVGAYRFYRVVGPSEWRRVHTVELWEGDVGSIGGDIDSHLTDASDAHDASAISFAPVGTIASDNVQAAIEEAATDAAGALSTHGGNANAHHNRQHSITSTSDHTFPGGTSDFLRADGTFATPASSGIPATTIDAKGDLLVGAADDTVARKAVGSNGQRLVPRSGNADGLAWEDELAAIEVTIDGGGSAITTGIKGDVEVPFACAITAVRLFADQTGSIVVDIWKDTYANYPPTNADTITASAKPTLSSASKSQDTTLTGWTTSVSAGDILRFNVDSAATVTRVVLSLTVRRT